MIEKKAKRGSVMVVGGGVAGMQAALDAAAAGFKVYLVEEKSALGGQASALDKTFPTNDCAMCMLSPRLVEIANNPNIELLTLADVKGLAGEAGDFQVTLRRRPRFVDVKKCTACGDCLEVCPVELPDPFNRGLSKRKAIGRLYPQAVPSAFAIERQGPPPCRVACPAGTNAQGYVALAAKGKFVEAYELIRKTNPFVSVCGRVCFHPCESNCTRALIDEPVAVMALKRYIADKVKAEGLLHPAPEALPAAGEPEEGRKIPVHVEATADVARRATRRVAIVGAGPAGLTAAYRLAGEGYAVTIFEEREKAGGMMRYGIPDYRLPKDALDFEIGEILAAGATLTTGWRLGRDGSVESLLADGFEAVFVAVGAWKPVTLGVEAA